MREITATQLPRFMACNGSKDLPSLPATREGNDTVRLEGNATHWLIEQVFLQGFDPTELIDRKDPEGTYITVEMVENVSEYLKDLKGAVEVDTSYTCEGVTVKGRADNINFENGILEVKDFKYGWGIVEPEENWTLISHAIGYLLNLVTTTGIDINLDVKAVIFKIYQPRPFHPCGKIREWSISALELLKYYEKLKKTLREPDGMLNTGTQCHNCPKYPVCPAAVKASMNSLDVSEKAFVSTISDDDLSDVLDELKRASKIISETLKAYEDLALHRVKAGRTIKNYSVERGLTARQWKDENLVSMFVGENDFLYDKKIISPTQAIKKGLDKELVNSLSERKETGLKLCKIDPTKKVEKMFGKFLKTLEGKSK